MGGDILLRPHYFLLKKVYNTCYRDTPAVTALINLGKDMADNICKIVCQMNEWLNVYRSVPPNSLILVRLFFRKIAFGTEEELGTIVKGMLNGVLDPKCLNQLYFLL